MNAYSNITYNIEKEDTTQMFMMDEWVLRKVVYPHSEILLGHENT